MRRETRGLNAWFKNRHLCFTKYLGGIMSKKYRTPPFLTPAAIVSLIVAVSAGNIVVNVATGTHEGGQVAPRQTSVVSSVSQSSSSSSTTPESSSTTAESSVTSSSDTKPTSSSSQSSVSDTKASSSSVPENTAPATSASAKTPDTAVSSSVPETTPAGGAK